MGCFCCNKEKEIDTSDVVVSRPFQENKPPLESSSEEGMVLVRDVAARNNRSLIKEVEIESKCPEANRIIKQLNSDGEPEAYECEEYQRAIRIEFVSPVVKEVVLTARSLFLNQNITTFAKDLDTETWKVGNYLTDLQLSPEDLKNLEGKRVLDLAGGAGLFPEEALAFGAEVDVIDLNAETYVEILNGPYKEKIEFFKLDGLINCADFVRFLYVRNLEIMHCQNEAKNFLGDFTKAFEIIYINRFQTAKTIHTGVCSRARGDATNLVGVNDNSYDLVLNCWMLNYLTDEQRLAVVGEVVRVTKLGGQIRLQGGHEDADGSAKTPELNTNNQKSFPSLDKQRLDHWAKLKKIDRLEEGVYKIGDKTVSVGKETDDKTFLLLNINN